MAAMGQEGDDVDHYEVLRLPSGEEGAALSVEQIEKAYRTQSRLRHPDKRPDDPNATADFQSLASSYKFLRMSPSAVSSMPASVAARPPPAPLPPGSSGGRPCPT
ncbi:hypothetical protein ZWY2020_031056 [Hordeum vulgare]|nr:hypothetical protein ZWY2020_031056 [Hordeum vulgare]